MTIERRERLKALILEAETLDEAARDTWLERLRGEDAALADEVTELLGVSIRPELSGEGLTRAISEALAEAPAPPLDLPRELGPYRLLEVIGHGGMGVVYRAEQTAPFHREVAVKALRGGWRPEDLRARVAAERRALALMEHPGIARLYDAIVDENGTPYLVMEMVRGEPITDYARTHTLGTRAILELFTGACRAVQHAHQRGIIHRDLKPANVLVTQMDGRATAKVIDFGVAKLLAEDEAHTRLTRDGQVVGTLDYMSPEQAAGHTTEADTRSDVYSLGVVLYELLSGRRPHELEGVRGHDALRRVAAGVARPLRQAAGDARSIASDLEAIVHKALEREPERRYDGPGALADDLERFLRDEPITARPPSAAYQLRVLVRRHRVPVLAGAALLAMLIVFGVTMAVLYRGQVRERERAASEAAKADAINRFLVGVLESPDPEHGARDITVHDLLDRKLAALPPEFGEQPEVMAEVQATLGRTYSGLGEYARADSLLGLALAVSRADAGDPATTIRLLLDLAKNAQRDGRFGNSSERATEAMEMARAWERRNPRVMRQASSLRGEALAAIGEAMLSEGQDQAQAERALLEAVEIEQRLHPGGSPELAEALLRLGRVYWSIGPWPRAESVLTEAMAVSERFDGARHPRQLEILTNLALVRRLMGRAGEAERDLSEVVERTRREFGRGHAAIGPALNNLAITLMDLDRQPEAESLLVEAIGVFEHSSARYHEDMSAAYKNLAGIFLALDDTENVTALSRKAIEVSRRHNGPDHWLEIVPLLYIAQVQSVHGRFAEAEPEARHALALSVRHRGSTSPRTQDTRNRLGYHLLAAGRSDSARVYAESLLRGYMDHVSIRALYELAGGRRGAALDPQTIAHLEETSKLPLAVMRHFVFCAAFALEREGKRAEAGRLRANLALTRTRLMAQLRPEVHARALAIARAARAEQRATDGAAATAAGR